MIDEEARRQAALNGGIYWSAAVLLQNRRLQELQAWVVEEARADRSFAATDDASRRIFFQLPADRDFLSVAACNFARALRLLEELGAGVLPLSDHVRVLRNCLEHCDEGEGPSFDRFNELFPGGDPTSHRWGPNGTIVGELDVDDLMQAVHQRREQLLELEWSTWTWRG